MQAWVWLAVVGVVAIRSLGVAAVKAGLGRRGRALAAAIAVLCQGLGLSRARLSWTAGVVSAPGYRRVANLGACKAGIRSLHAGGDGLARPTRLTRTLPGSGAVEIGCAIRAGRGLLAGTAALAGSGLTAGRSPTGGIGRAGILGRASGSVAVASLASAGTGTRTADLRGASHVVHALAAGAVGAGGAGGASRFLRAADVTITGRGIVAGSAGARNTGPCAVAGLGGQGRTCACGSAGCCPGAKLATAGPVAHPRQATGNVRGSAGIVGRLACRNRKALAIGLPIQGSCACRAPSARLVAAHAVGHHARGALGARGRGSSIGKLRRASLGHSVAVARRAVAVRCRCTGLRTPRLGT